MSLGAHEEFIRETGTAGSRGDYITAATGGAGKDSPATDSGEGA